MVDFLIPMGSLAVQEERGIPFPMCKFESFLREMLAKARMRRLERFPISLTSAIPLRQSRKT
jgi:hypothetical protein